MGFFDSKTKNTTNAYDQSQTSTFNSSLAGGDNEMDDSIVLTHSNLSTVDNSLALSMSDNSYKDSSTRTATTNNSDSSNNSFNLNTSGSDYSQQSTTNITTTDGGSFQMVSGVVGKMIDAIAGNQNKLIDMVGLNQKATLSASNDLVSRSMDAAKGATLASEETTGKMKLYAGVAAALSLGGLVIFKLVRGK